jgi:hypothetical protein
MTVEEIMPIGPREPVVSAVVRRRETISNRKKPAWEAGSHHAVALERGAVGESEEAGLVFVNPWGSHPRDTIPDHSTVVILATFPLHGKYLVRDCILIV